MNIYEKDENNIVFECNCNGLNIEEFLKRKKLSGRLFRKLYKNKKILVNGFFERKTKILKEGDLVGLIFEDEDNNIKPEAMNLDIVYEDGDILVINKEANIVVHPTKSHQTRTLSNGISHYYKLNNIRRKIRFVNRLDMDTSGLLIVAKHPFAHQQIADQFQENTVVKKYLALVDGLVEKDEAFIEEPIGREEEGSVRKMVRANGQNALTSYSVVERYKKSSLLELQLFTGRSHQIRVHLSYIGHPIIGDILYHKPSDYIERQALHSYFLGISGIRDGKKLEFNSKLPRDMEDLVKTLKYL